MVVAVPFLAKNLVVGSLTIEQETISEGLAIAISCLMSKIGKDKSELNSIYTKEKLNERVVVHLRIEDCMMSDKAFSWLLKGLAQQGQLETFVYQGNCFGLSSMSSISSLFDAQLKNGVYLKELTFSNIQGISSEITRQLVDKIFSTCRTLHFLKLS